MLAEVYGATSARSSASEVRPRAACRNGARSAAPLASRLARDADLSSTASMTSARSELDAIETFGGIASAEVAVSLAYEAGPRRVAGRAGASRRSSRSPPSTSPAPPTTSTTQPQSRAAMHHLERNLFEPSADARRADARGAAARGGGERAELELVAEEIKALLDAGVSPQEMAVVHRTPAAIATLLEGIFRARQIPYSLQLQKRFAHSALGAAAIALLRCASGNGTAADLLRWLRAPGVLQRPELADQLELRVRRQGVRDADGARELWEAENWQLSAIDRLAASSREGTLELIGALERQLGMTFSAPRETTGGATPRARARGCRRTGRGARRARAAA